MILHPDDSLTPAAEMIYNQNQPFWWDAARIIEDDFTFPLHEKAPSEHLSGKGKRKSTISKNNTGYYIYASPANKDYSDIARDATLRSAALKQIDRNLRDDQKDLAINIEPDDIMKKVRIRKKSSLIIFLIDLSWSMSVTKRLSATKNAITTILAKAYQFRDDICLISFQKESASLIIPPTHSITLAEKMMKKVSAGGKTPLAAGLELAYEVIQKQIPVYGKENISLILLSDCDGNIPFPPGSSFDARAQAVQAAKRIASQRIRSIIINSDQMSFGQGNANDLAKHMNASCYLISGLNADHLIKAVRSELIQ